MFSHAEGEGEHLWKTLLRAVRYVKDGPAPVFTSKLVPTETRPSFFPCAKAEEFFVGIPYGEFIAALF